MRNAAVIVALAFSSLASADELSQLSGRVLDQNTGTPVQGALVMVSGPSGLVKTLTTDAQGRYSTALEANTYNVIFAHGPSRTSARIVLAGTATLDGKVDAMLGTEVIEITERVPPPVAPKAKNFKPRATPPYSDEAVLSDAWTKAHLLLDVDEQGVVRRYKFLKRPGYDLEKIAGKEVSKLEFEPARDGNGKPVRVWIVWSIEWPSAWWLAKFNLPRSTMPPVVGFPPRRMDHYVPCKGSGPMNLGSLHPTYKDCSKPDLSKANVEKWIDAAK